MKKRALSLALAVLMLVSLMPVSAMADAAVSGTYTDDNGITYTLEGGTLTISGEGECSDAWQACLDRNAVTAVVIEDGITSIGDYALIACSSLKSVSIGSSVTAIGEKAFSDCDLLESVSIPDGVTAIGDYAFYGCEALAGITIPDSVISIGSYAFNTCRSLTSVSLGSGITSIGERAFTYCGLLASISIPDSVTSIGFDAFYSTAYYSNKSNWDNDMLYLDNCLINSQGASGYCSIKDGTRLIADGVFCYSDSIRSVSIPGSVTHIGNRAFEECAALESVSLGNGVTLIGSEAFARCSALKSISIPDSVRCISNHAFSCCGKLESVRIGTGVTSIEVLAFDSCPSLADVYYDGTCEQWSAISIGAYNECLTNATRHITHNYTDAVTEPTCTEQGYTTHACVCGDAYVDSYVDALGHDTELVNAKEAACAEDGYTGDEVCKTCGEAVKTGAVIPMIGHDTELVNAKEAACAEDGYTGDEVCKTCGETVKTGAVIPMIGHDTELVNAKEATCTEDGYTGDEVCKTCGETVKTGTVAPALGHDTYITGEKEATCTEAGYTGVEICKTCGIMVNVGTVIEALGHSYKDTVIAPTCVKRGYTLHTCTVCGNACYDSFVDALGHDNHVINARPASCTDDGYTGDEICKTCGAMYRLGSVIAATGHDTYIAGAKDATCTEPGYTGSEMCRSCGEILVSGVQTAALGHDTELVNAQPATCTCEGYSGDEVCTRCGVTVVKGSRLAMPAHDYADGACTVCGAKDPDYMEPAPSISFSDVPETAYYAQPVAWAVAQGITGGYSDGTFRPMAICSRAQIVTFIWRANGSPEPLGTAKGFNDVAEGTYYCKAVLWAAENGITGGYDDGGFHPDELVTRAQAMTFLWRAEGKPAVPAGAVNTFTDVPEGAYYHDAVLWAVANGITGGYNNTQFGSMDGCTRAQIVTFLYRDMA